MPAIISKAPGKTILFGEHAVVYGFPAIAVPLTAIQTKVSILPRLKNNRSLIRFRNPSWKEDIYFENLKLNNPVRVTVENISKLIESKIPNFEMTVSSSIPISAGLGSSAALAVSISKGFSQFLGIKLSKEEINDLAFKSEIVQHGSPSGIDNSVVTYSRPIYYISGQPMIQIKITKPVHLILADSGKRSLTKDVVKSVREKWENKPNIINQIFEGIGDLVKKAHPAMRNGNIHLIGKLMTQNHSALQRLDVSLPELDHLVNSAILHGASGAKLCGAGKGGYMVAASTLENTESIRDGLLSAGARNIISTKINPT